VTWSGRCGSTIGTNIEIAVFCLIRGGTPPPPPPPPPPPTLHLRTRTYPVLLSIIFGILDNDVQKPGNCHGFKHFALLLIMDIFGFSVPLLQLDISQKTRRFT